VIVDKDEEAANAEGIGTAVLIPSRLGTCLLKDYAFFQNVPGEH
jgi:hypothetical protein